LTDFLTQLNHLSTTPVWRNHSLLYGQYEELRPAQIDAIRKAAPIAYIPWGALEWHSYHNPIGLDCLKAHGILLELAKRTGGIIVPPVYIGTDTIKPFKGFPHTIDFPEEMVKSLAHRFVQQLADEKFRLIVLYTGHYGGGHLKVLKEVEEEWNAENKEARVWFTSDLYLLEGKFEPNHAAWGETSFQLYFDSNLVDLTALPEDRTVELDRDGVMGRDPREATALGGAEQLEALLENAVPKVKALLEELGV
jgi:creatinine amidohydrolase